MKAHIEVDTKTGEICHIYVVDKDDEIWSSLMLIGETAKRGSQLLKTGRGKRLFNQMIEPEYRDLAKEWTAKCRCIYGQRPREVAMDIDDFVVVEKLAELCRVL